MLRKNQPKDEGTAAEPEQVGLLGEPLLGVHSAPTAEWLAEAVGVAAERGLGALYCFFFLTDAEGRLQGQRPASSERMRNLVKVHQALEQELISYKFDPGDRPALAQALQQGTAVALSDLAQALPLDEARLRNAGRQLGVDAVWVAPLYWNAESTGLLLLLMPADRPASLAEAELLGRHAGVALHNQREREAGRRRGDIDAIRWVHDEHRFRDQLAQEVRRAARHKRPLSIMVLRVQNLDDFRTRYGRFLSERLLRQLGNRLADAIRDTDFLGAFGDDGFATILVEADQGGAARAKERLLEGLQSLSLPNVDLPDLQTRLSYATATLPEDGETAEELTAAAEQHMGGGLQQDAAA